jgi:hypothetical protein
MNTPNTADPTSMDELLQRIEQAWHELNQLVSALSESQLETPGPGGWTIKDNRAHLTAWEQFLIRYHLKDEPPHEVLGMDKATLEAADEDAINDFLFQHSRPRPATDVLADFRRSHQELLATLKQMKFADLMQPHFDDDPEKRPLLGWVIGNTYDHYQGHASIIRDLLHNAA